jgi:hypothetical protein
MSDDKSPSPSFWGRLGLALGVAIALTALGGPGRAWALSDREIARVERLLADLETQTGFIFIRNGREYQAREAVQHLRRKLKAAADRLENAEDFVERAASGSSVSGRPYLYKVTAADAPRPIKPYLYERLNRGRP